MAMLQNNAYQMPIMGHHGVSDMVNSHKRYGFTIPIIDESLNNSVALRNGYKRPIVGLGMFRVEGNEMKDLILHAIRIGYRHFDCAAKYQNEQELGDAIAEAIKQGLVKREELFITSKIWNSDHDHVLDAWKDSLKKLQLDYLDLYLIHFPVPTPHTGNAFGFYRYFRHYQASREIFFKRNNIDIWSIYILPAGVGKPTSVKGEEGVLDIDTIISLETVWRGMEDLVNKGLVRSIGVSNYSLLLTRVFGLCKDKACCQSN